MNIVKPIITEKTIRLAEEMNMYTFEVRRDSNKSESSKELEQMFGVKVGDVRVHNRLGKKVRFGRSRRNGQTGNKKIMIFRLTKGSIDIFRN